MDGYKFGYIGTLDILGFGAYCCDKHNFSVLDSLMSNLYAIKKTYEYNFEENICIMSDTLIIMVEIDNDQKYDAVYFNSLVEWLAMVMITIRYKIGLFCRGSVTIGDYFFNNSQNILFGPGIVRGVTLAEKIDKISEIYMVDNKLMERPAALIIDNLFFSYPDETIKKKLLDNMTVELVKNSPKYISVGANYYIYNTYFSEYDYYKLGNDKSNKLNTFIEEAKKRINKQSGEQGLDKKYYFEKKCLNMFIESKKTS